MPTPHTSQNKIPTATHRLVLFTAIDVRNVHVQCRRARYPSEHVHTTQQRQPRQQRVATRPKLFAEIRGRTLPPGSGRPFRLTRWAERKYKANIRSSRRPVVQ